MEICPRLFRFPTRSSHGFRLAEFNASVLLRDLFADHEAITKEMSSQIEKMVRAAVA